MWKDFRLLVSIATSVQVSELFVDNEKRLSAHLLRTEDMIVDAARRLLDLISGQLYPSDD